MKNYKSILTPSLLNHPSLQFPIIITSYETLQTNIKFSTIHSHHSSRSCICSQQGLPSYARSLKLILSTSYKDLVVSQRYPLHAYFDSNWKSNSTNSPVHYEILCLIEKSLFSWRIKKQTTIACSSIEE